jgi:signal transduction histidine kinase
LIPLLAFLDCFVAYSSHEEGTKYRGVSFIFFTLLVVLFGCLLVISRKGYYRMATFILIGLYFTTPTYGALRWGVELPLVAISYIVIIVISSILISTRFGFFITSIISLTITAVCLLQSHHIITPLLYWKYTPVRINDAIELSAVFFLVTIVSWLSNKEMEKSLVRARASESALVEERNMLEIKVEERTKELKQAQEEKIGQLYRFAEFGRVSSGVFHDLMNSLQVVVSTVTKLEDKDAVPEIKDHLAKAVSASKRMGTYMETVRKQIATDDAIMTFSLQKEIQDAVDILQFHAREARTTVDFRSEHHLTLHGNPIKFYQLAFNILANAIDACKENVEPSSIMVRLYENKHKQNITLVIKDTGCGIDPSVIEHIFNPFFTTKQHHRGIGIGLSQTKEIVEKDFKGTISVSSTVGRGSTFTMAFPHCITEIIAEK